MPTMELDIFSSFGPGEAPLSRRLEPVAGHPSAPGSHRCRGRNRNRDRFRLRIVVGPHARCSLVTLVSSASRHDAVQQGFMGRVPCIRFRVFQIPSFCPSIPIPIPIPTPTPMIIPTAVGTRLSCIENNPNSSGRRCPRSAHPCRYDRHAASPGSSPARHKHPQENQKPAEKQRRRDRLIQKYNAPEDPYQGDQIE
jgi:hypothetical protein